jgi:hypothetical protein
VDDRNVTYTYVKGVRVFNLIVELDRLPARLDHVGRLVKRNLLERCEAKQFLIQRELRSAAADIAEQTYPIKEKLFGLMELLGEALGVPFAGGVIRAELATLEEVWRAEALYPFRDATTKNMVLADSGLWLGNFGGDEGARRAAIIGALDKAASNPEWLAAPIVDFDFASCVDLTTPEDDPISLKFHERTWRAPPRSPEDVLWADVLPDGRRAAITFLVRYYRFGGRKAAYRLIHPKGHRIRFRYDCDMFYFSRLPQLVRDMWPDVDDVLPETLAFTRALSRSLGYNRPAVDYFIAEGFAESRRYYVDMYPE